jgi:hypothetical protein
MKKFTGQQKLIDVSLAVATGEAAVWKEHRQNRTKCNIKYELAVPWLRRLFAGLSPQRPGFYTGSVNAGFVVDKVALRQGFPLSVSFHWFSITRKNEKPNDIIGLRNKPQDCFRSICCGALHKKRPKWPEQNKQAVGSARDYSSTANCRTQILSLFCGLFVTFRSI